MNMNIAKWKTIVMPWQTTCKSPVVLKTLLDNLLSCFSETFIYFFSYPQVVDFSILAVLFVTGCYSALISALH